MRFLFDTDHVSILQRKMGREYSNILAHAVHFAADDLACSIVSFEEQTRGATVYVKAAQRPAEAVRRYRMLETVLNDYAKRTVLPFDDLAAAAISRLTTVRVGTMDLRIASIALSRGLIVLTRNTKDFGRVPGLSIEDWTV